MPLGSEHPEDSFFAEFDIFIVLTTLSGTYISRFGNFCVHDNNNDNNDDMTDHFTPAHARGIINMSWLKNC